LLDVRDVVVPVDGSAASLEALALACSLAKRNKGTVYAVYVIEVARAMPLDAEMADEAGRGEEILTQAEDAAEELDYRVSGELLQARDRGHAIVDEAIEREAGAIIMGVSYDMTLGEFQLGETAEYVVRHAPCPVVLYRGPAQGPVG
jgi:nucleotide-binding universal stress UspA family protein